MSDNLNETNNEINESNQSETVENKTEAVEEQHTEDVTETVQEAMSTQKRCSVAYRSYGFTLIQCFLYQWRNKFCFRRIPLIATDKH